MKRLENIVVINGILEGLFMTPPDTVNEQPVNNNKKTPKCD